MNAWFVAGPAVDVGARLGGSATGPGVGVGEGDMLVGSTEGASLIGSTEGASLTGSTEGASLTGSTEGASLVGSADGAMETGSEEGAGVAASVMRVLDGTDGAAVREAVGVFADSTATAVGAAVRWLAVGADVGASTVPVGRAVVEAEGSDVGGSVLGMGDGA
jgi:hypothetical protein